MAVCQYCEQRLRGDGDSGDWLKKETVTVQREPYTPPEDFRDDTDLRTEVLVCPNCETVLYIPDEAV